MGVTVLSSQLDATQSRSYAPVVKEVESLDPQTQET